MTFHRHPVPTTTAPTLAELVQSLRNANSAAEAFNTFDRNHADETQAVLDEWTRLNNEAAIADCEWKIALAHSELGPEIRRALDTGVLVL